MPADWSAVRDAYLDGDYSKCLELLAGAPDPHASFWRARIAAREGRPAEHIAHLHELACPDEESRAERDVWLASYYAAAADFSHAHSLLDRAMAVLAPPAETYYRGVYVRALANYLSGEFEAALTNAEELLTSADGNDRGQAHALRSWIALKRADMQGQLDSMVDALEEYLRLERPDQYGLGFTLQSLAVFCRERPIDQTIRQRVRIAATRLRLTGVTGFSYFQTTRLLGWDDALHGDELSAIRRWRDAEACAPSEFWRVFCVVDRAFLAQVMHRASAAAELLEQADSLAHALTWSQTHEEERLILLTIAQLFSQTEPARAERYLAMYRSLGTSMHLLLKSEGDPRFHALELYPHAVALLNLGETHAISMLEEAWNIFTHVDYRWRAAQAALDLYRATNQTQWLERAREQAAPWPKSWIARDVRELG